MIRSKYSESVFLNVPFDDAYKKIFQALIFAVYDCGCVARSALESDDGTEVRIQKLYRIISQCKYSIHDISRTELDPTNNLPRFNMPLELGIFLGAKHFGRAKHRAKKGLILDREPYRYQKFCSDIAGQDIRSHALKIKQAIKCVREWLRAERQNEGQTLPGANHIHKRYVLFRKQLPALCKHHNMDCGDLSFNDYSIFVIGWLKANPR
ncbi:MAG TPA: hypothetical protein VFO91_16285 [Anaerolineales bacterium]|nr:hypothetical protein [Anaerolineales bacterium]